MQLFQKSTFILCQRRLSVRSKLSEAIQNQNAQNEDIDSPVQDHRPHFPCKTNSNRQVLLKAKKRSTRQTEPKGRQRAKDKLEENDDKRERWV
jgi:hypothetical protein